MNPTSRLILTFGFALLAFGTCFAQSTDEPTASPNSEQVPAAKKTAIGTTNEFDSCAKCTFEFLKRSVQGPREAFQQVNQALEPTRMSLFNEHSRCLSESIAKNALGFDESCGFETHVNRAQKCGKSQCGEALTQVACRDSMWKDRDLGQRLKAVIEVGSVIENYGVDPRALACVAAIETENLEPLTIEASSCDDPLRNQKRGLGQTSFGTFKRLIDEGFASRVAPFDKPPLSGDPQKLFDAMATSVPLQLEVLAASLRARMPNSKPGSNSNVSASPRDKSNDLLVAFQNYGGTARKNYASSLMKCFSCLQGKMDEKGNSRRASQPATDCLDFTTYPLGKLVYSGPAASSYPNQKALPSAIQRFAKFKEGCASGKSMRCLDPGAASK